MSDGTVRRCSTCHEVVQRGVVCKQEYYHRQCFTCTACHSPLAGQRSIRHQHNTYCLSCFGDLFEEKCFACRKPITGIGDVLQIYFSSNHWHPRCFLCSVCNTSLVGQLVVFHTDDIFCISCAPY